MANAIELKKGDNVLDIGCGWGRLVQHFADKYGAHISCCCHCGMLIGVAEGAKVTGVTLSSEQRKFGLELNKHNDAQVRPTPCRYPCMRPSSEQFELHARESGIPCASCSSE